MKKKENPPRGGGLLVECSSGGPNDQHNIKANENAQAQRWLIHRYGVPKIRARAVAELAGIGGGHG